MVPIEFQLVRFTGEKKIIYYNIRGFLTPKLSHVLSQNTKNADPQHKQNVEQCPKYDVSSLTYCS